MNLILKLLACIFVFIDKVSNKLYSFFCKRLFLKYGRNVSISKGSFFSFRNIVLGDNVFIGKGAYFSTIIKSGIVIGDKVMFGPNVSLIGGNHNIKQVGSYMYDVENKNDDDDLPIIIERDVWIGANVVILKGVTIGEGSVVAAGAVVLKSVPSYSIVVGNPGKVLRKRFSDELLKEHIAKLKRDI